MKHNFVNPYADFTKQEQQQTILKGFFSREKVSIGIEIY